MVLWCFERRLLPVAYFLKKSLLKKGLYLQIYESFYDPLKKQTTHRSHLAIGYAVAVSV